MTPAELEAIRARNAARTPKTWQPVAVEIFFGRKGFLEEVHDDVNALLAEVERLRARAEGAEKARDAWQEVRNDLDRDWRREVNRADKAEAEVERLRRALEAAKIGCASEECRVELLSYDTACGCDEKRDRDAHNAAIDAALRG